jgi:hypothetical protein
LPETNKYSAGGARTGWPLLSWLPLIVAAVLLLSGCASQSSQPSDQEPRRSAEEQTREPRTAASGGEGEASGGELGPPTLGDADAPVVMVEYGDFQ